MSKIVSELLLDILKKAGVNQVFGVTGDALNTFVEAVRKQDELKWVAMRHEENAAFAAYGQAAITGKLAVCAGTVGPGALHLINGLYNAKRERVPVLAISGQVPTIEMGSAYFQEVNLEKTFDDVCAYQGIIRSPEQAHRVILKAIQIAIQERTVCRIELPSDIAAMKIDDKALQYSVYNSGARLMPAADEVAHAARLINEHSTVTILAGEGCREHKDEVIALAKKLKAPIVHTLKSSDIFDQDSPNVVGLTGLLGTPAGYYSVKKADLLLMLGTDFPYRDFLPKDKTIIQCDIRISNIGNRVMVDQAVLGDIGFLTSALYPLVDEKTDSTFLDGVLHKSDDWQKHIIKDSSPTRDHEPLHPQIFAHEIGNLASEDAVFTCDVGESTIWAARYINYNKGRRLLGSFNHGSMAVAFPAALGAQALNPDRQVWALIGDGAFGMSMQDFVTAVRYKWPVKIIVFNNSELAFVKTEMEEAGLPVFNDALHLQNPDFAAYAKACGGDGIRVEKAHEIIPAILKAIRSDLPFIIDAIVSPGEISLPPGITLKEAWGFGTSKFKEFALSLKGDEHQWKNLWEEFKTFVD